MQEQAALKNLQPKPHSPSRRPVIIVQGGQWGSEAKGAITAFLTSHTNARWVVRTGAVNAGHTVRLRDGREYKMQQLPCGFLNPRTQLVIGAGAMIHPDILLREIEMLEAAGYNIMSRLYIDYRAGLHTPEHQTKAAAANRHHSMGATGKGCSEAIVAKITGRGSESGKLFKDWWEANPDADTTDIRPSTLPNVPRWWWTDTEELLNNAIDDGEQVILESTQGTLLDLHLGPYPYTTHKQTGPSQWAMECGLSPALDYEIALVCRTYPIRVAGNSGPMPSEISWITLADRINTRLTRLGRPPLISDRALNEFASVRFQIALDKYGISNPTFPNFSAADRVTHRVAISELDRDTLGAMSLDTLAELTRLFEMTTVTRKLRRIAEWDWPTMDAVIRQTRPTYIVLTFLNYVFPQFWGETNPAVVFADNQVREYIHTMEREAGVPIRYITTGPGSEHVLEVAHGLTKAFCQQPVHTN